MAGAGPKNGSVGVAGGGSAKIDSLEALSKYFTMPEKMVAKELGICLTSLKKLCRQYGITRWPYRKLKSIQRTMAKVQDDAASSGMAAQLQAAGIVIAEGGADGPTGGEGSRENGKMSQLAQSVKVEDTDYDMPSGGKGDGNKKDGKKRKPYTVNGKTVFMTEEEKKLFSISMGDGGGMGLTLVTTKQFSNGSGQKRSAPVTPSSRVISPGTAAVLHSASESPYPPVTPPVFSCEAQGTCLLVHNWQELWTQVHLEQRLLKPLGGVGLSIVEGGSTARLEFENERTASRAQLICREAAKAAAENIRNREKSRSKSPDMQRKCSSLPPTNSSDKLTLDMHSSLGKAPDSEDSVGGTGALSSSENAVSPLFRMQPVSPSGVFGMWDTSSLVMTGPVDSTSLDSLVSGNTNSFLDSSGPNPFSGMSQDALCNALIAPGSGGGNDALLAISPADAAAFVSDALPLQSGSGTMQSTSPMDTTLRSTSPVESKAEVGAVGAAEEAKGGETLEGEGGGWGGGKSGNG